MNPAQPQPRPWKLVLTEGPPGSQLPREMVVRDAAGEVVEHRNLGAHSPERANELIENARLYVAAVNERG